MFSAIDAFGDAATNMPRSLGNSAESAASFLITDGKVVSLSSRSDMTVSIASSQVAIEIAATLSSLVCRPSADRCVI